VEVLRHPETKKHLGLARVTFGTVKAARQCVAKYDQGQIMGKTVAAFFDPNGKF
jgi:histone-lysine N-methyltransferase SETD1